MFQTRLKIQVDSKSGKTRYHDRVWSSLCAALVIFCLSNNFVYSQVQAQTHALANLYDNPVYKGTVSGAIRTSVGKDISEQRIRESNDTSIHYRRWFVPFDRIRDWPTQDGPYAPVEREKFERWIELTKLSSRKRGEKQQKSLTRIFLKAKLDGRQLIEGHGFLDLSGSLPIDAEIPISTTKTSTKERTSFLTLEPWNLHTEAVKWDDDSAASIVRKSDGETAVLVPHAKIDSESIRRLHFNWSLRGRMDSQARLLFDLALPESTSFEIQLELPSHMIPSVPSGIVERIVENVNKKAQDPNLKSADNETKKNINFDRSVNPSFSRWRLLLRHEKKTTLTLSVDERFVVAQQKTGYRNRTYYSITSQGLDVTARIQLDKTDSMIGELYVDIEEPLRVLEVTVSDRNVSWNTLESDGHRTKIYINLKNIGKNENREIIIKAIGPFLEKQNWNLPLVEVVSPHVFWNETRCAVIVQNPLVVEKIECPDADQVVPLTVAEQTDREVFAYSFFRPDARIALNLGYQEPRTTRNSFTQIHWAGNEIKSETVIDLNLSEGEIFSVDLPVSDYWTVNTIKASPDDMIASWDISETGIMETTPKNSSRRLNIQLQKPYRAKEAPLRFLIQGRFLASPHQQFKLKELSPFDFSEAKNETHLIAIQLEPPFQLKSPTPNNTVLESHEFLLKSMSRFQSIQPQGNIYVQNSRNGERLFSIEQLNPNYNAEIEGIVQVRKNELHLIYRIRCIPVESSVDRIYLYFSSINTLNGNARWQWNSGDISQITAKRLKTAEWTKLFSMRDQQDVPEEKRLGECWELRLDTPRSIPFEIQAELSMPLEETLPISLAALPLASNQKAEIHIEAARLPNYQIVNSRLQSIPIALPIWYRYQNIRAAFRYDPVDEFRQLHPSPILFKRVSKEDVPPSAWVWMLRLDTQYENEGIVKNNAVFLVENRGKDTLRISLPTGIRTNDVHAVWLDEKRITWHPDLENDSSNENVSQSNTKNGKKLPNTVVVVLPEGRRFVSVSLEYSYQDKKLTLHRNLNPRYPKADVPVLTASWTSWFPPDYDVSARFQNNSLDGKPERSLSRAADYYFSSRYFNLLSLSSWQNLIYEKQHQLEALNASKIFLSWMSSLLSESSELSNIVSRQENSGRTNLNSSSAFQGLENRPAERTWADLIQARSVLNNMIFSDKTLDVAGNNRKQRIRKDTENSAGVKIMIDRQAFNYYGITPTSPLALDDTIQTRIHPNEILEQQGLVLLVCPRINERKEQEYVFYITSFLMSAIQHQFDSEQIDNNVRFIPDETRLYPDKKRIKNQDDRESWSTDIGTPQWIPAEDWIRETSTMTFPWSVSAQVSRLASITPDWIAYEMPGTRNNSLYIVHRNTFKAYHFLAFLSILLLTWKRPFSSPIILIPLIFVFEFWARWTVPCHLGIPSGFFFGTVCSLCFEMIRSHAKRTENGMLKIRNSKIVPPVLDQGNSEDSIEVRIPDLSPNGEYPKFEKERNSKRNEDGTSEPSIKTEVFFSQFPDAVSPVDQEQKELSGFPEKQQDVEDQKTKPPSDDQGKTLGFWFFIVLLLFWGFAISSPLFSAELPETSGSASPPNQSSTQSISEQRKISSRPENKLSSFNENETSEPPQTSERVFKSSNVDVPYTISDKETYRIFYPMDENQNPVGDFVWLPESFFRWLSRHVQTVSPKATQLWSIEKAEYEGILSSSSLSQGLMISEFKVVFHILLEESNTSIVLPALPIVSDTALWDDGPIQPVWQIREKQGETSNEKNENRLLVFNLENERKGRHRLELTLDPLVLKSDDLRQISFGIPKIPNSVLKLNVPVDAPTIQVNDSFGAVTQNSSDSTTLSAEIGPSDKLAFQWTDEQIRSDNAKISVETLFRMKTRPVQLRTKFRYRIESGKIRTIDILTDPRWQLSGQFHCEEQPIERIETFYDSIDGDENDILAHQNEITRLVFKSPVSGIITIQASFMLKEFSGIGNVRLPQIRPLHTETVRSLLAVYDDSFLELELPETETETDFESLWQPGFSGDSKTFQENKSVSSEMAGVSEQDDKPAAVYDLAKTKPSWFLSIRSKENRPELALKQFYYFDSGESILFSQASFSSVRDVFQIPFTVSDSFRIHAIEIRDSDGNPIENRWTDSQRQTTHSKERDYFLRTSATNLSGPVQRTETANSPSRELIIFLKQPLSGKFNVTITGRFDSVEKNGSATDLPDKKYEIPLPMFTQSKLAEHSLECFRSPAVLPEIEIDEQCWEPLEKIAEPPKSFYRPLSNGSWNERPKAISFRNDKKKHDRKSKDAIPLFRILPNRPTVRGDIVTTLSRAPSGNSWELTFDVLWTINQGELRTIDFQWDERCGTILSVQPQIPMTVEQKNGKTQLHLNPNIPFSGKQHFRIKALLNPVGNTISVPAIEAILENVDYFRNNVFIVLPRDFAGIAIPWNLSKLAPADSETVEYLKEQTGLKFKDEHQTPFTDPSVLSSTFMNVSPTTFGSITLPGVEFPVREAISSSEPLFYKAAGNDFTASIVQRNEKPIATIYDITYCIRKSGNLFGLMTIDLKSRGNDSFILTLPPKFELIQLTSSGMGSSGSRLMDRRWKIDLSSSDYPQRINVVFRGSLELSGSGYGSERSETIPFSLSKLQKNRLSATIPLPTLENVEIKETLWTLSFESDTNSEKPMLSVSSVHEETIVPEDPVLPFYKRDIAESLGKYIPVSGQSASETLIKLDLVRLNNLLVSLDSFAKPVPAAKLEEVGRWESQWSREWNGLIKMIEHQRLAFPQAIYANEHCVLLDSKEKKQESAASQNIGTFLDSMKPTEISLRALLLRKNKLIGDLGLVSSTNSVDLSRQLSASFLVHYRSRMNESTSHLFGAGEGSLKELRIESVPVSAAWTKEFLKRSLLWTLVSLVLLLFFSRLHAHEFVVQFPHFWGAATGLILWSFSPVGLFGLVVLALVFFSLCYSPWPRRELISDKNGLG